MRILLPSFALVLACAPRPADDTTDAGTPAPSSSTQASSHGSSASASPPASSAPGARDAGASSSTGTRDAGTSSSTGTSSGNGAPMLLHVADGQLVHVAGNPVDFRGAISCCGGGNGWPLVDVPWIDHVAGLGVNFLHVRLGPFLTGEGGESDWAATGGGYAQVDGKADLSRWNEAFWTKVRALLSHARARGLYVEVDVADGWAIKHCRWGDTPGYSAWDPAWNVQGVDACAAAGSGPIVAGSVHDLWVRRVVAETGSFDNVVYQDGNELGLVAGYDPAWTASMAAIIHAEETARGFPRHLFGTQSEDADAMALAEVDYLEFHRATPVPPSSCAGKPCLVNEYNPDPPIAPEELFRRYCTARGQGTSFWYWRHGQTEQAMDATLSLIRGGCP